MKIAVRVTALILAAITLPACGKTDFDVQIAPPAVPVIAAKSNSSSQKNQVSVIGAEQLNFVLNPLTTICNPVNFRVNYAAAATSSIEQALGGIEGGHERNPRKFTVTIEDFNARVMSQFVESFVMRHDVEVRVTLLSQESTSTGPEVARRGAASLYHEPAPDTSGFCDDGQLSLAHTMKAVFSEALERLVRDIERGKVANPVGSTSPTPANNSPST
ncbi:MAG: hypothetical protein ACPGRZ_00435 [Alphaproteobacteria bacterium]